MDYKLLAIIFLIMAVPLFGGVMATDLTIQKDTASDDLLNYTVFTNSYGVDQFWVDNDGFVYANGTLVTGGTVLSIHNIGNVTAIGCAEDQFLKVNSTGFFACADGTGADNLGNHIATQDLNMSSNDIYLDATQLICFDGIGCEVNITGSNNILDLYTNDSFTSRVDINTATILFVTDDDTVNGRPNLVLKNTSPYVTGKGPFIRFEVKGPNGTLFDAIELNGGLVQSTAGNEQGDLDINVYKDGIKSGIAIRGDYAGFFPKTNNVWDLGISSPSTLKWRDLFLARNADIDGTLDVAGTSDFHADMDMNGFDINNCGNCAAGSSDWVLLDSTILSSTSSQIDLSFSGGYNWLKMNCFLNETGTAIDLNLRPNITVGTDKASRYSTDGGADTTTTSTGRIELKGSTTTDMHADILISNIPGEYHGVTAQIVTLPTTAATAPSRTTSTGFWGDVVDITSMRIHETLSGSYGIGSVCSIWGSD